MLGGAKIRPGGCKEFELPPPDLKSGFVASGEISGRSIATIIEQSSCFSLPPLIPVQCMRVHDRHAALAIAAASLSRLSMASADSETRQHHLSAEGPERRLKTSSSRRGESGAPPPPRCGLDRRRLLHLQMQ